MPEYRWALHDFSPENEDELSFHSGDVIEIVEKDDMYGDGWWQVRYLCMTAQLSTLAELIRFLALILGACWRWTSGTIPDGVHLRTTSTYGGTCIRTTFGSKLDSRLPS